MNELSFGGATGENLLFFLVHGLATVFYSFLKKNYPHIPHQCPRWLGVVLVNAFAFATTPLFTQPFIRAGFFDGKLACPL